VTSWTDDSAAWLQEQIAAHPEMTKPELRRWCRRNYPFAERRGWAYKAWLKALRAYFNPQAVRPIVRGVMRPSAAELERAGQERLPLFEESTQGDQPRFERGREGMEPTVCESAVGRGTDGAPALTTLPRIASLGGGPTGTEQPAAAGLTGEQVAA
jgi:hypothetical protein